MSKVFNRDVDLAGGSKLMKGTTTLIDADGNFNAPIVTTNLTTTGNTILGDAASDTCAINGATSILSTSASALAAGRLGATTPALQVDASTATCVTGLKVKAAGSGAGLALSTVGGGTNESLTIDAKGSGTVTINGTATGIVALPAGSTIGGSAVAALGVVTSNSATALAVGLNGATNSAFVVDSSTGSQAAGLKVVGATAAGTVAASVISSGADANLSLDAKGAGTLTLNGTATGAIALSRATTVLAAGGISSTTATGLFPVYLCAVQDTPAPTAACSVANFLTTLDSTAGATTQTLAASTVKGQMKKIEMKVSGGNDVVTVTGLLGGTTLTFSAVGQYALLQHNGTNWVPLELSSQADGVAGPALA